MGIMKILAVSDQEVSELQCPGLRQRFGDVDMVLSCGDLPYSYLQHIAATLSVPCFYVHGNHDQPEYMSSGATLLTPEGWTNLHGRTVCSRGVLLAGLEGSMRYRPNAPYQHTEVEMALQVWSMAPALAVNRLRYGRYLDILISHSPPFGIQDGEDPAHRGFQALGRLARTFRPRYLLHGHQHAYAQQPCQSLYLCTEVVNVHPFRVLEW
jgi:Icc-related predicted phosphoesterase